MTTNMLPDREARLREIARGAAVRAFGLPERPSGLWFHGDIRDNFYYASHLFAAAADPDSDLPFDRGEAKAAAVRVLGEVLALQNADPAAELYGHWPLGLGPSPREARPNPLPAELMAGLMAYFAARYDAALPEALRAAFREALAHAYRSRFYDKPLRAFNHHEAKYTALKLIFGRRFADASLLADGRRSLKRTLAHVRERGMAEYGALPWFWHWVQAFTCALELAGDGGGREDEEERADLRGLLDWLWNERALYYLKGAWAAPHFRALAHDLPKDGNVLFDYAQFGDFPLPADLPRLEYAGLLFYEAPEEARRTALDRRKPAEVRKRIASEGGGEETALHAYTYMTARFAAGGVLERREEFDNEQHRWDVTLPLLASGSVNKAYFFHPGRGYAEGDPRHRSGHEQVLFHKNVVMALYDIPETEDGRIVGVLPKGEWIAAGNALHALVNDVYLTVYLMQPFALREEPDRMTVVCPGRRHGVVVEAMSAEDADCMGIDGLEALIAGRKQRPPVFGDGEALRIDYVTRQGQPLRLRWDDAYGTPASEPANSGGGAWR
ncbi:hypothetical protein SAMN02799624_03154 [Paenibacillus sp. UNC496MF]|uniref:hypothetical protein n=1 Tax=Paenibacillus sp. UNC496MF TaxID=1502753 RepID=UPI0008F1C589|nr:hypothetical protein [Paenibacillus sp. UNC496MF]SFJ04468.1 hypothetical protein SAMN02799624_03154 [Paenibacillus sp. UNC496MF]